jgi:hypothetical protein
VTLNTHNLNITGEEMTPKGNTYIQDAFLILLRRKEFVKTGINIGTFDASLFEDEDEDKHER